jgi:hypothetical protein
MNRICLQKESADNLRILAGISMGGINLIIPNGGKMKEYCLILSSGGGDNMEDSDFPFSKADEYSAIACACSFLGIPLIITLGIIGVFT